MTNENPYLIELENHSDDEIFEILSNTDETENPSKYTAAISIALKRELISEYQSMELLEGNISVLEYNPNNIGKQAEDYQKEEELRVEEAKRGKISNIHYGLILMVVGFVLLFFAYSGELFFPTKTKIIGTISIIVGFLVLISGYFEKYKKRDNELL